MNIKPITYEEACFLYENGVIFMLRAGGPWLEWNGHPKWTIAEKMLVQYGIEVSDAD